MSLFKNIHAELISWTREIVPTVHYLWNKSKVDQYATSIAETIQSYHSLPKFKERADELFLMIIRQEIPIAENIEFIFMLHHIPISLREQMVRHRIGAHYGDNFGVDIFAEIEKSSFWAQSMRLKDMSHFTDESLNYGGGYFIPPAIEADPESLKIYADTMTAIETGYAALVQRGQRFEDARNLVPLGAVHDMSWRLSLQTLIHVLGKRSCWILQLGIWEPVIRSMVEELVTKVSPIFQDLILPPCFSKGEFTNCKYELENERRVDGSDKLPLCPLYYQHHHVPNVPENNEILSNEQFKEMDELAPRHGKLWGRDPYTGELPEQK